MDKPTADAANPALARYRLSTESVESNRRLDYWVDMISRSFGKLKCEALAPSPMSGLIETSRIGALELTRLQSLGQTVRRTTEVAADDDQYLVQMQRQGRCVVRQDGRTAVALPGDFVLYDSARPYELILDDPSHDVWVLRLGRGELERHIGALNELTAITVDGASASARVLASMLELLHGDTDVLNPGASHNMSEALASTVAAGLRILPGANAKKSSGLAGYHIARVKTYVRANLRDPELSVTSIAKAMQMSPDNLYRLFKGESPPLSRWLWQQRLEACKRELLDPRMLKRSISDIAFSWGFSDAAHFSRSFREHFGLSARELRRLEPDADAASPRSFPSS